MSGIAMPDWLAKRARLTPQRIGLEAGGEQYTFAQMHRNVAEVAALLAERGVGRGDRVALLLPNGTHFVWTVHALARLGAVSVPSAAPGGTRDGGTDSGSRRVAPGLPSSLAQRAADLRATRVPILCVGESTHAASYCDTVRAGPHAHHHLHVGHHGRPKEPCSLSQSWWSAVGSVLNLACRG